MATTNAASNTFEHEDHQTAYVFHPAGDNARQERPAKRRRIPKGKQAVSASARVTEDEGVSSTFVPLLNGAEKPEWVSRRETLFNQCWSHIYTDVQHILRESNQATLDQVSTFVNLARSENSGRIPSAFIITGPNIASQDLLFQQLAETLEATSTSRFVRLRSGDASNLKAALKKIVRDLTARTSDDNEDDVEVAIGRDGRRYLDYDLEGLYAFIQPIECEHVFVAFQDSEGFDSGLLSDLIHLFSSWLPRIPFTLLFGVATSVDLLQARLLSSTVQFIYGAQFDVVQSSTILERIFRTAVAGANVPLRFGPGLLQSLLDRQRDHAAGIQVFVNSLKYAYMCHFYANPLSAFVEDKESLATIQPEHFEAIRMLPSFQVHVEAAISKGQLDHVRRLLDDDSYLALEIRKLPELRDKWIVQLLRSLQILNAARGLTEEFSASFVSAVSEGIDLAAESSTSLDMIKRMQPTEIIALMGRILDVIKACDTTLSLPGWAPDAEQLVSCLEELVEESQSLRARAEKKGNTLRSTYSGQSRVLRTTVVAQKVQLSHDSAALSDEDKDFTKVVDRLAEKLTECVRCQSMTSLFLHEVWLYDSKSPYRDVFIPRPRAVLERSLTRPHDYLDCSCCSQAGDGIASTLPATALLYRLYIETGSLINVADLWSAFYALVGEENEGGMDERTALAEFYRALANLRALGFVKASRKKADHIAKLKWL